MVFFTRFRKFFTIATFVLLTLEAAQAVPNALINTRDSYQLIKEPDLGPYYRSVISASNKIPTKASVIVVPDQNGTNTANFWFAGYYLLPRKLYLFKERKPYRLTEVPRQLIKSRKIKWVLYDNGDSVKAVPFENAARREVKK